MTSNAKELHYTLDNKKYKKCWKKEPTWEIKCGSSQNCFALLRPRGSLTKRYKIGFPNRNEIIFKAAVCTIQPFPVSSVHSFDLCDIRGEVKFHPECVNNRILAQITG